MSIRRVIGVILIGAAYWVLRGRFAAMSFEVRAGNSWGGVMSDIEYLLPGIGAFLALAGGTAAALGIGGRVLASNGTVLVLAFVGLVGGLSGQYEMIQPFAVPVVIMMAATIGLVFTKSN